MRRVGFSLASAVLSALLFSMPAAGEERLSADRPEVKAVRGMIEALVSACRAGDKDGVMKHFSKSAIVETKKQPAIIYSFMELCVDLDVGEDAEISLDGNRMTIKQSVKDEDGTVVTQVMKLVKEEGQWKFGTE